MKTYENVKCDVNVRIKIKKPPLFQVWLFGVDLTMCKFKKTSNHIRNAVKYYVKKRYLNDKIYNGSK